MDKCPHFKVWNHKNHCWLTDFFDDYLELNWYNPRFGKNQSGECWVELKDVRGDMEIIYADSNGQFISPES